MQAHVFSDGSSIAVEDRSLTTTDSIRGISKFHCHSALEATNAYRVVVEFDLVNKAEGTECFYFNHCAPDDAELFSMFELACCMTAKGAPLEGFKAYELVEDLCNFPLEDAFEFAEIDLDKFKVAG